MCIGKGMRRCLRSGWSIMRRRVMWVNWMLLSCTAFFGMFYRVYSPVAFERKTYVEGTFVKHFVPELEKFDRKYIYEPWKASIADQKRWGCVIKGDGSVQEE